MIIVTPPSTGGDATADVQAALSAARGNGCRVEFRPGVYRMSTVSVTDDGAIDAPRGVHLLGENGGAHGFCSTVFEYDGPDDQPILKLLSRDCIVEGIAFRAKSGRRVSAAIEVDKSTAPGALICTNNAFRRIQVVGNNGGLGSIQWGIRVGASGAYNCEFMHVEDSLFSFCSEASYFVDNTTMQAKGHTFERCVMQYGAAGVKMRSGSFQARDVRGTGLSVAFHTRGMAEPCLISASNFEQCGRLLDTQLEGAGTTAPVHFHIEHTRFAVVAQSTQYPWGVPPDGKVINYTHRGPLSLEHVTFDRGGTSADAALRVCAAGAANGEGTPLLVRACHFPNPTPFSWGSSYHERTVEASTYDVVNASGVRTGWARLPDERAVRYPR